MTRSPLAWPSGWKRTDAEYFITEDGHIFRQRNGRMRELAQHPDKDGYMCVLVYVALGRRRHLRVHRALLETFVGPRPHGMVTRHLDDVKRHNYLGNLCWGTVAENSADAMKHGKVASGLRNGAHTKPWKRRLGTDNGNSKLMPRQVLAVFEDPRSQTNIAADFSINQTLVSQIKLGRVWNHITGLPKRNQAKAQRELA